MKKLKLRKLALENFKGIKSFVLDANGHDVRVFGDNATGKTSVFDGFVWLLFDKDSQNKKDFQVKTLVDGKELHNLEHAVEAELIVDGRPLLLKKVFKEKWTKKRGSATASFTGHTTDYFVDGVPSKKKEFADAVAGLVDEDTFKLLTNPAYFNEHMHWKERRELLLEIAGDVSDEDVITSNKDLSKLLDVLNGKSIEDHKKIIAAKRKEINAELERIPVRINEVNRGLPDLTGLDKKKIMTAMDNLLDELDQKQVKINSIQSGGEINNLKAQMSDIDLQIANVCNEHKQQGQNQLFKWKTRKQEEQSNLGILQSKKRGTEYEVTSKEDEVQRSKDKLVSLRTEWNEIKKTKFIHEDACECPTCGQELPSEQIETAKEKAKSAFNLKKSTQLEEINARGQKGKDHITKLEEEITVHKKELSKLNDQITAKEAEISKLDTQIQDAESAVSPIEENVQYQKLTKERQSLEEQIETMQSSVNESIQAVRDEINELKEKQSALQADMNEFKQAEQSYERISELEEQESHLAKEFEELEHQRYLAEEFTRTKVNLLTEKINSKFKYARFNLFKENINGGLEETCETTYDGVPYGSGLNNAARINVGLDIINTLSEHYGVQAPIFVDNAESITQLLDIEAQLISLIVSRIDKQLRVENATDEIKEAI